MNLLSKTMLKDLSQTWLKLKMLMWAAAFRHDFKYCYINLPFELQSEVTIYSDYRAYSVHFIVHDSVRIYIPYDIQFAFLNGCDCNPEDELPF